MEPNRRIFINCPYDKGYKHFFVLIVFYCLYFGYEPIFACDEMGGRTRVEKIIDMMNSCEYAIHDISTPKDKLPRYNMVFELGLDYMIRHQNDLTNKLLIIEKKQNQYSKTLSDLGGCDIYPHNNDQLTLVKLLRKFFLGFNAYDGDLPTGQALFDIYIKTFNKWIQTEGRKSPEERYDDLDVPEIKRRAKEYFSIHQEVLPKMMINVSKLTITPTTNRAST